MKTLRCFLLTLSIIVTILSCNLFEPGTGNKVDVDKPTIEVTSHDGGETVKGSITIKGSYNEDIDVEYIRLSFDNGASYKNATINKEENTWSLGVDTTKYKDNKYSIIVEIKDTAEKTAKTTFLLYFDNHGPLVLVEIPQNYATGEYNGDLTIQGKAADKYGIATVFVTAYDPDGKAIKRPKKSNTNTIKRLWKKMPDGSIILESMKSFLERQLKGKDPTTTEATGKESWSYTFESKPDPLFPETYITGDYAFYIQATDFAGNKNTYFFHNDDVKEVAGEEVLAYDLHLIDIGDPDVPESPPITFDEMKTIRKNNTTNKFLLTFDQNDDKPDFVFSNPVQGGTAEDNTFGANAKASGMVTDDDGVNESTIKIQISGTGITDPEFVTPSDTTGSGLSFTWSHDLSALGEGSYTLQIRASDIYGCSADSVTVPFSIDEGAPTIDVTSPLNGAYVNGNFTITGNASDGDQVNRVGISFNSSPPYTYDYDNVETTDQFLNWTYDVTVSVDETMYVRVMAEDNMGNSAYFNLQVIADITAPAVNFINPPNSSTVNGTILVKGTASDNSSIEEVELRIGKPESWQELSGIYNWEYELDTMSYASVTYATDIDPEPDSEVWELYIQACATDKAGNVKIVTDYVIYIDNDMDKPTVNIISPSDGQNIAGPVLISGTAFDDDAVHHVEMLIDINGDGDFEDQVDYRGDSNGTPDEDTDDLFEDETNPDWYTIEGKTLWTQEINSFGEMYETETGHDGTITIRVRAVDTKDGINPDVKGNYQEFTIHLDDTIPRVENLSHSSSDYVSGTFTLTGDALDDVFVDLIGVSYNGGISYPPIVEDNIVLDAAKVTKNSVKDFDLHIEIDSESYIPTSGILYLRIKIIDDANYQSISYINLNVDNEYPTALWDSVNIDPNDIRTTSADVQGTATDSGAVSGIDMVEVYFIRDGNVYNPETGATTGQETTNFGDGDGSVPYTTDTAYKIIIDNPIEAGNDGGINGDDDGFNESLTRAGSTYTWWAEFNSTIIPDGTIDIHYVAFDNAGNADHNVENGLIANDKPQFTGIIVGYDVDDSGSVQAGERFSYSSEFEAANKLYIQISANDDDTPLTYEVLHEGSGPNLIESGNSCEIDISEEPEGSTYYLCRVTDDTDVFNTIQVEVNIENDDFENPAITITPLTLGNIVDGHIELDGDSLHNGTDPDVSGELIIQGTAYDNQGINSITLTLNGESDPTVAVWSGGTLVSDNTGFTIESQTFNANGHSVSWTYTWNSATVTGSAASDTVIDFDITDFAANSPSPDIDNLTVDVVPYITDIARTDGADVIRSKLGKYSLPEGITNVDIHGYNLDVRSINPGSGNVEWIRIYNSGDTASTDLSYDDGDVQISDFKKVTVDFDALVMYSGCLRLCVNGVEAINNINDNDLSYNSEDDGNHPDWYDDRYIHLWDVGNQFDQSSDAEHAAMAVVSNGTQYASWSHYGNSRVYYDAAGSTRTEIYRIYDPPEWTDIAVNSENRIYITFLSNNTTGTTAGYGGLVMYSANCDQNTNRDYDYYGTPYIEEAEWLGHDTLLFQFRNPRILAYGNNDDTHVYISYYDSLAKALKFAHFRDTNTNVYNNTLDTDTDSTTDSPIYSPDNDQNIIDGTQDPGTGDDVGMYSDIAVDNNGYPLIVYYDTTNQTLKLARADRVSPTPTAGNWHIQNVFDGSDPNRLYSGQYVSVQTDTSGNVYISCYRNSTGDLIYVYADNVAWGVDYDFDSSVVVDSEGAVGARSEISLLGTTPYIAYLDTSMAGTFEGLKYAYLEGSEWEHGTVALNAGIDGDERLSIAALPSGANPSSENDYIISIGYNTGPYNFCRLRPEQ